MLCSPQQLRIHFRSKQRDADGELCVLARAGEVAQCPLFKGSIVGAAGTVIWLWFGKETAHVGDQDALLAHNKSDEPSATIPMSWAQAHLGKSISQCTAEELKRLLEESTWVSSDQAPDWLSSWDHRLHLTVDESKKTQKTGCASQKKRESGNSEPKQSAPEKKRGKKAAGKGSVD